MNKSQVNEAEPALALEVNEAPPAKPIARIKAEKSANKEVAVAQPQKAMSLLELCMMASRDNDMPAEKVRAFLDMAKEQKREEAKILFDEAMLAAQAEMPKIPRDAFNKHTKSWWARIEQVADKCDPTIRKHGFVLKYGMGEPRMDGHYYVFADVTWNGKLSSGEKASHTERYGLDIGRDDVGAKGGGTKTGAQGSVSVLTYGRRNLKLSIFDVLVLGMDRDGNPAGREGITPDGLKDLRKRMKDVGIEETVVCEFCKIERLDQIDVGQLEMVNDRIEQRKAMTK